MAQGHWIALGIVASLGAAGCGGPSDAEKRAAQQRYATMARSACATASADLGADDSRPRSLAGLTRSLKQATVTLRTQAKDLHDLHGSLEDASSDRIDAFDGAIDPYVKSVDGLAKTQDTTDLPAAERSVKQRGDALYRAAQRAKLSTCGRGGNAIADRAVYMVYRVGYSRLNHSTYKRLNSAHHRYQRASRGSFERDSAALRITRTLSTLYRGMGRLKPTHAIRRAHRSYRSSLREVLKTRKGIEHTRSYARYQQLRTRLTRQVRTLRRRQALLTLALGGLPRVGDLLSK